METLIYFEKCADGSLAKYIRYPSGLVVIHFEKLDEMELEKVS